MKSNNPCIKCITLPVCRSKLKEIESRYGAHMLAIKIMIQALLKKCDLFRAHFGKDMSDSQVIEYVLGEDND